MKKYDFKTPSHQGGFGQSIEWLESTVNDPPGEAPFHLTSAPKKSTPGSFLLLFRTAQGAVGHDGFPTFCHKSSPDSTPPLGTPKKCRVSDVTYPGCAAQGGDPWAVEFHAVGMVRRSRSIPGVTRGRHRTWKPRPRFDGFLRQAFPLLPNVLIFWTITDLTLWRAAIKSVG